MKSLLVAVFALVAGMTGSAATPSAEEGGGIRVDQAWARASILGSRPGVAYLTIRNEGSSADRLLGATSPAAGSVMIHVSEMSGDVMKMHGVPDLEIAPGEQVVLKPGGTHLMLMELREPLRKGERLPLSLDFEHAGTVAVSASILSPGAKGPKDE